MMNLYAKREKPQAPFCVCVLTAGLPFFSLSFFYCPFAGLTIFFLITITILIKNRFNNMTISYAYSIIQHRYICIVYQNHLQISLVSYLVSLFSVVVVVVVSLCFEEAERWRAFYLFSCCNFDGCPFKKRMNDRSTNAQPSMKKILCEVCFDIHNILYLFFFIIFYYIL